MKTLFQTEKLQLIAWTLGAGDFVKPEYTKIPLKRVYSITLYWRAKYGGTINVHKPLFRFGPLIISRRDNQLFAITEVLEGTSRGLTLWVLLDEDDTLGFERTVVYQ